MAIYDCSACEELRQTAPNFVVNGMSDTECASLANNTGLNPSSGHNDCEDLNDMNDCLIKNMENEINAYNVCSWKDFMKALVNNMWTMHKGIICALCGIWTALSAIPTNIAEQLAQILCYIDYILDGRDASALLDESAFEAGTGVDFNRSGDHISKPGIRISGSTYTVTGSIRINITTEHWGRLGLTPTGNRVKWGSGDSDYNRLNTPSGNYTICIIKIPKTSLPWLKSLSSCVGSFVNAGVGQIYVNAYDGDTSDNQMTGQWGYSSTAVTVPAGYIYLRISLISLTTWGIEYGDADTANGGDGYADVTFRATGLARTNRSGITC